VGYAERELRDGYATWQWVSMTSRAAWLLLCQTSRNLGYENLAAAHTLRALPDVLSEAIEAAEALGL